MVDLEKAEALRVEMMRTKYEAEKRVRDEFQEVWRVFWRCTKCGTAHKTFLVVGGTCERGSLCCAAPVREHRYSAPPVEARAL